MKKEQRLMSVLFKDEKETQEVNQMLEDGWRVVQMVAVSENVSISCGGVDAIRERKGQCGAMLVLEREIEA